MLGSYLFRFESHGSDDIKGMPIPIDAANAAILAAEDAEQWGVVREDAPLCLCISTLRKRYLLKFADASLAAQWRSAVLQRRADCVREQLGHLPLRCDAWKRCNQMGNKRFFGRLQKEHDEAQRGMEPISGDRMHAM